MATGEVLGHEGYYHSTKDRKSNKSVLSDIAIGNKWFVTNTVACAASCAFNYISCLEEDRKELLSKIARLEKTVEAERTAHDQLKKTYEEYRAYAETQIQVWKDKLSVSEACCQLKMNTLRSINDLLKNHVFEDNVNAQSNQGQELPQTTVPESKCEARPRSRKRTPKVPEKAQSGTLS